MLDFVTIGKVFTFISKAATTSQDIWRMIPPQWRNVASKYVREWLTKMDHSIPQPVIAAVSKWSSLVREVSNPV